MPLKSRNSNDILYDAYKEIFKDSFNPRNTYYYHVKRSPGQKHIIDEAFVAITKLKVPPRRFGKRLRSVKRTSRRKSKRKSRRKRRSYTKHKCVCSIKHKRRSTKKKCICLRR